MDFLEVYKGKADRAARIAYEESLGHQMRSDTFDPDWKRGDEPHGTMVFTDVLSLDPALPRNALKELDDLKALLIQKGVI